MEIQDNGCQDLEKLTTELTMRLLLPLPYRQLNHITASMWNLSLEMLRLNLSVFLRKFLLNIHLNPSEYGGPI